MVTQLKLNEMQWFKIQINKLYRHDQVLLLLHVREWMVTAVKQLQENRYMH